MKMNRANLLTLSLALTAAFCALGLATKAQAQQIVYYPPSLASQIVYYPAGPAAYELHYHRVYQGTYWHWSPALGWHTHDHYIDVPYWAPRSYVYPQSLRDSTITTYYFR